MEIKVQMPFQQLLDVVKGLTSAQKTRLRQELDQEKSNQKNHDDFLDYLLKGPVYSDKEIEVKKTEKASQHGGQRVNG